MSTGPDSDSPVLSAKFNSPDADVTFKSSDGVLFRIHRKNLEVCTEGFPPPEISAVHPNEVVDLTETAATLELLFQFIYPQRHPALDTTPFEVLEPLAEAAEKYQVFPAMNICHIRLRDMVHEHPVAVAIYAAKHDYPYLVSEVAPMMISMPTVEVFEMLPPYLILPWVRYVQEWTKVLQQIAVKNPQGPSTFSYNSVNHICYHRFARMERLAAGIHTLRALDEVFDDPGDLDKHFANCCQPAMLKWRKRIEDGIAAIPKFSTFL